MIIIGEKINTINKDVAHALNIKNELFFKNLVKKQIDSGIVDVIDVNVGSDIKIEPNNMKWVLSCIESLIDDKVTFCIDSSNPQTIIEGIEQLKNKKETFINSITLEEKRYKELLPLAKKYDLNIIALPVNNKGIPSTSTERLELSKKIIKIVEGYDIDLSRLYIDCLVQPIALSNQNAIEALDTVKKIKNYLPQVRTVICLTAISFGMPNKKLIRESFLSLLLREGIDSIILDPLDSELIDNLFTIELLLGKDENCLSYINRMRGK